MKANIIKFLFGIVITINVILYPVGKTISEPANINAAMTSIDFEQKFLDIFKEVTIQQLATSTNQSVEIISNQIQGDLISKDELKQQREEQVNKFYKDLEAGKVPNFRLEIENPISKFTSSLQDKAKDFINNVQDIQICAKGDESFLCQTLGDTINSILGRDKDGNVVDQNTKPADQPNFVFETSLGIDQNNVQNWSTAYKVLKYGPDGLLMISLGLMALFYLLTWPKTKSAIAILITVIRADIFAAITWGLIPILFNVSNPIRITSEADVQGNVNLIITGAISETSRNALLIPVIFTVISLLMVLFTLILPKFSVSRILDDSGKIKGHGSYGKPDKSENEDNEEEEDSVEEDETDHKNDGESKKKTSDIEVENFVIKPKATTQEAEKLSNPVKIDK